jgi:hypothetical protein
MAHPTKQQLDSIKPIAITSLYDIRKVITPFMPHEPKKSSVTAKMTGVNGESGTRAVFEVSAPASCDYYSQFRRGMDSLKARSDAVAKLGERAAKVLNIDAPTMVDNIIKTKMGGKREGLRVRWDIGPDTYYFDPFSGTLSKRPGA